MQKWLEATTRWNASGLELCMWERPDAASDRALNRSYLGRLGLTRCSCSQVSQVHQHQELMVCVRMLRGICPKYIAMPEWNVFWANFLHILTSTKFISIKHVLPCKLSQDSRTDYNAGFLSEWAGPQSDLCLGSRNVYSKEPGFAKSRAAKQPCSHELLLKFCTNFEGL